MFSFQAIMLSSVLLFHACLAADSVADMRADITNADDFIEFLHQYNAPSTPDVAVDTTADTDVAAKGPPHRMHHHTAAEADALVRTKGVTAKTVDGNLYRVLNGVAFDGADVPSLHLSMSSTPGECADLCVHHAGCAIWVFFISAGAKRCRLSTKEAYLVYRLGNDDVVSGVDEAAVRSGSSSRAALGSAAGAAAVSAAAPAAASPGFFLVGGAVDHPAQCVDLFGARYPAAGPGVPMQWPCAAWRAVATSNVPKAVRIVAYGAASFPTPSAPSRGPGGDELCLTVSDTAYQGVRAAPCTFSGAASTAVAGQTWIATAFASSSAEIQLNAPRTPCAVRLKWGDGLCLTAAGKCNMTQMGDSSYLEPCRDGDVRQRWQLASGAIAAPRCDGPSSGIVADMMMAVASARTACEVIAKAEFSVVSKNARTATEMATEVKAYHTFRTDTRLDTGPCMFASSSGKRHGEEGIRGTNDVLLVGSGNCNPWETIVIKRTYTGNTVALRAHSGEAEEGPLRCLSAADTSSGCRKGLCLSLVKCNYATDAKQTWFVDLLHGNKVAIRSASQQLCATWKGWGSPLALLPCDKSTAQTWQRASSRLVSAKHRDVYRSFADIYAPVPPTYLEWIVRSHLASSDSETSAKARAAVAHFTPSKYMENVSSVRGGKLKKVFSWALFIPNEVVDVNTYGPTISKDAHYKQAAAKAPKTLAEAQSGRLYSGRSFFKKYISQMLDGLEFIRQHLNGWGVIVHLAPELEWLAPLLLESGIVRVGIMSEQALRTSGAFWRWIPFDDKSLDLIIAVDADDCADDTSGTVLAKLWEAVDAWGSEPDALDVEQRWSSHSVFRWLTGWDRGVVDNNCGNVQYAPIQANVLGVKPKQLTYSMRDAMAGFALQRMVDVSFDAQGIPFLGPLHRKTWEICLNHPGTNAYPSRRHGFMNGHGCALWSYGFDELFTKQVVFHRAVAEGTLYSAIPDSSTLPPDLMLPHVDPEQLRCSNAFYLDAMCVCKEGEGERGSLLLFTNAFPSLPRVHYQVHGTDPNQTDCSGVSPPPHQRRRRHAAAFKQLHRS